MSGINSSKFLVTDKSTLLSTKRSGDQSLEDLKENMKHILEEKIHGICFSPYKEGDDPNLKVRISKEQIRERLTIIAPYTEWVRVFSCSNGNEFIPEIAHELGMKTLVGAWLDDHLESNEEEIANLIQIAKEGFADIVSVGNELLLREELTEDQLLDYINRVKLELPDIPVGYVDAYYTFTDFPKIADACDVILCNCYPFWECCSLEYSLDYMKQMFEKAMQAANGKKVIITETGWPSEGSQYGGALPSFENAMEYFIQTYKWANEDQIDIFYFSSFDEKWKEKDEGEYGSAWGIWDKEGSYKFS